MRAQNVHESPRRGTARRIAAAMLAVAAIFTLGACKATGGGQIGAPVPSGSLPVTLPPLDFGDGTFTGNANFGFNFTCEITAKNKAVIKGQLSYRDSGSSVIDGVDYRPIKLHGVVDPMTFTAADCETAAQLFFDAARFEGTYRSEDTSLLSALPGRFNVLVFDQGEPGRTKEPLFVTGDGFAIELTGGPYTLYTRAGYIEGGNIQVDNT